jgi:hypothetical protein
MSKLLNRRDWGNSALLTSSLSDLYGTNYLSWLVINNDELTDSGIRDLSPCRRTPQLLQ